MADLAKIWSETDPKPATRSAGTEQIELCEVYLNGTLAFVFVPYDSAETTFSSLADEFNGRYGTVQPRSFRTQVDYGIFQPNFQRISLGIYNWTSEEQEIEFVEPRGIDYEAYLYSKGYAYLLYLDQRRLDELAVLRAQVAAEEASAENAARESRERQRQETLQEF